MRLTITLLLALTPLLDRYMGAVLHLPTELRTFVRVGVILCSGKSEALVRYATDALPTKLLVREYLTALPDEKVLAAELERTRNQLESRK